MHAVKKLRESSGDLVDTGQLPKPDKTTLKPRKKEILDSEELLTSKVSESAEPTMWLLRGFPPPAPEDGVLCPSPRKGIAVSNLAHAAKLNRLPVIAPAIVLPSGVKFGDPNPHVRGILQRLPWLWGRGQVEEALLLLADFYDLAVACDSSCGV